VIAFANTCCESGSSTSVTKKLFSFAFGTAAAVTDGPSPTRLGPADRLFARTDRNLQEFFAGQAALVGARYCLSGTLRLDEERAAGARARSNADALALIDRWMSEDPAYDLEVWPLVEAEIERNRLSARRRFDD